MSAWTKIQRLLSLLIGLTYAALILAPLLHGGGQNVALATLVCMETCAVIAIPVALIWFPEQIGAATGMLGNNNITAETPPFLVALMGWIFLLGAPLVYYIWH